MGTIHRFYVDGYPSYVHKRCWSRPITRGEMNTGLDNARILAYETHARYAAGEAWITLDVVAGRRGHAA